MKTIVALITVAAIVATQVVVVAASIALPVLGCIWLWNHI